MEGGGGIDPCTAIDTMTGWGCFIKEGLKITEFKMKEGEENRKMVEETDHK